MAKVPAAFLRRGFLKLGTALLIASTPVREEEPDDSALRKITKVIPGTADPTAEAA